jgi:hypothetical protein
VVISVGVQTEVLVEQGVIEDEFMKSPIAQGSNLFQDSSPLAWIPEEMLEYVSGVGPGHITNGSLKCVGDDVDGFVRGTHVLGDGKDVVVTGGVVFLRSPRRYIPNDASWLITCIVR